LVKERGFGHDNGEKKALLGIDSLRLARKALLLVNAKKARKE
jgi:hypothetical protein